MKLKDLITNSKLPLLEAELIIAHLLNLSREQVIAKPELEVSSSTAKEFQSLERKRLRNHPLAYLLGNKNFYRLNFKVNRHVMVPRPETEQMIDYVLNNIVTRSSSKTFNFLDVGTGSGAIIISLAHALKNDNTETYELSQFMASDISAPALEVAQENTHSHGFTSKIALLESDLIEQIPEKFLQASDRQLVICANLPYLSPSEWRREPSISREPKVALRSQDMGLRHYGRLFKQLKAKQVSSFYLICEINPQQKNTIEALAQHNLDGINYSSYFLNDHTRRVRFFVIKTKA